MPPTNLYVYVAGPLSVGDQFENVAIAIRLGHVLRDHGFVPFVPHMCSFWHMMHPCSYESWMAYDFAWLDKCDALIRLPGDSAGADREVERAKVHGKPVFFMTDGMMLDGAWPWILPPDMKEWQRSQHGSVHP